MVGGGNHCGWVLGACFKIMQRRVGIERFELFFIRWRAIVGFPGPANSELIETQHVHDANGRKRCAKEIGPLGDASTHQKTAVAATCDR